jgi:anaerobic C4-dicarboxylate transporter
VTKKTETNNEQGSNEASFRVWFFLFAAVSVALIVYNQGLTIESAHSLIAMVFVRQMSLIYSEYTKGVEHARIIEDLEARMDKIDPYKED